MQTYLESEAIVDQYSTIAFPQLVFKGISFNFNPVWELSDLF